MLPGSFSRSMKAAARSGNHRDSPGPKLEVEAETTYWRLETRSAMRNAVIAHTATISAAPAQRNAEEGFAAGYAAMDGAADPASTAVSNEVSNEASDTAPDVAQAAVAPAASVAKSSASSVPPTTITTREKSP